MECQSRLGGVRLSPSLSFGGSSRHMIGEHGHLNTLSKGNYSHKVEIRDKNSYPIKGIGSTSIELEFGGNIHHNKILYIPGLKENLLSTSCLKDKGDMIKFIDGNLVVCARRKKYARIL